MQSNDPEKRQTRIFPNPLLGESEGELKSRRNRENFAKYLRKSMEQYYRK